MLLILDETTNISKEVRACDIGAYETGLLRPTHLLGKCSFRMSCTTKQNAVTLHPIKELFWLMKYYTRKSLRISIAFKS